MNETTFSPNFYGKLSDTLIRAGFLSSIVTTETPRFQKYLRKPACLLHDRWTFHDDLTPGSATYRLGQRHGLFQEIQLERKAGRATLTASDPKSGMTQTIVYDTTAKKVISNRLQKPYRGRSKRYDVLIDENSEVELKFVPPARTKKPKTCPVYRELALLATRDA